MTSMNLNKMSIEDADLSGKRVLMRVDFNVPMDKEGNITNNQRIVGAIPSIKLALDKGAKAVILMSHMGRPFGQTNASMSLKPVAVRLGELLEKEVTFLPDCVGADVEAACADPAAGSIIMLENLRFHAEEEGKGTVDGTKKGEVFKPSADEVTAFRASLTKLGDVYVCDAFGTVHRAHSSMVGVDLPVKVAGLLVLKELKAFSRVLDEPEKPLIAIVGGAKISDKIKLIDNLIEKADGIIICGGMAYTFLKTCFGMDIGNSLFDKKGAEIVQSILDKAKAGGVDVTLPVDWLCGKEFKNDQETKMVTQAEGIPEGWEGMDCGPKSMALFAEKIAGARTVVWNGPAGVFEFENFSKGTYAILDSVAKLHASGGVGMIGGGDSATAAANAGMEDKVTFVSTGGGASLELLEGKQLPGIVNLADKGYAPKTVQEAWDNHFDAFGSQNVDKILLDYDESSVIRVFDHTSGEKTVFEGVEGARKLFTGLFADLSDLSTLAAPVVDVEEDPKQVFLIWSCAGCGYVSVQDTFLFSDTNKIGRQNIAATIVKK